MAAGKMTMRALPMFITSRAVPIMRSLKRSGDDPRVLEKALQGFVPVETSPAPRLSTSNTVSARPIRCITPSERPAWYPPMRIAQIAPLYETTPPRLYGGTERVVAYLTDALVQLRHDVTLFASADAATKARLG